MSSHDLIDTGEMYLRTVLECEEEDIVPLRARIAERLGHSVPTVSQTVARMERDGLLVMAEGRRIELTPAGRERAVQVMRKHRLAECLLVDVIGLDWELVHEEACRWEHVMSETVERRLLEILDHPTESPYGNPIPGLDDLGEHGTSRRRTLIPLTELSESVERVTIRRIGEPLQSDTDLLARLRHAGVRPGRQVRMRHEAGQLWLGDIPDAISLPPEIADHVFVSAVVAGGSDADAA